MTCKEPRRTFLKRRKISNHRPFVDNLFNKWLLTNNRKGKMKLVPYNPYLNLSLMYKFQNLYAKFSPLPSLLCTQSRFPIPITYFYEKCLCIWLGNKNITLNFFCQKPLFSLKITLLILFLQSWLEHQHQSQ